MTSYLSGADGDRWGWNWGGRDCGSGSGSGGGGRWGGHGRGSGSGSGGKGHGSGSVVAVLAAVARVRDRYARLQEGYQRRLSELRTRLDELNIVREELAKLAELEKKGLISSDRLFSLRRSESSVIGRRSADLAAIAAIKEDIANVELLILELDDKRSSAAESELQQLQQQLVELRERVRSAEQISNRKTIVAPVSGTVINLNFHTSGGVIKSGEPILDIVPGSPNLVVNARVEPKDRDVIKSGLSAEIRFSAFSCRHTKPLGGTVVFVSSDSIEDVATKQPYYLARVAIDPIPADASLSIADLHPGMQAEVMIVTGKRTVLTVLEYLTQPFERTLARVEGGLGGHGRGSKAS